MLTVKVFVGFIVLEKHVVSVSKKLNQPLNLIVGINFVKTVSIHGLYKSGSTRVVHTVEVL